MNMSALFWFTVGALTLPCLMSLGILVLALIMAYKTSTRKDKSG